MEDVLPFDLIPFDELTYPEVASLPRDLPLVLPLGLGYDHAALAARLGGPPQIGLLPALPFGWQGSGLDVPQPVFEAVLRNLLGNLLEDGFSKVFALIPAGLRLTTDIPTVSLARHPSLYSRRMTARK